MKKIVLPTLVALAVSASGAFGADLGGKMVTKAPPPPPSPWDIAFGGGIASDYNFRGISQSDKGASPFAYFEPRYNVSKDLQLYAGIAGYGTKLPTQPTAEIDLYGGIRPTFGALALDFGGIYYYYPREQQLFSDGAVTFTTTSPLPGLFPYTVADTDFWEVYAKATYTVNDTFSFGGSVYYSPNVLRSGAEGTFAAGNVKWVTPLAVNGVGAYISADVGHYWLGTFDALGVSVPLPDYTTWDVGIAFTYKVFTLDLRYYDTDLSTANCYTLTGDVRGVNDQTFTSKWCSSTFIAKLSFDMTLDSLK